MQKRYQRIISKGFILIVILTLFYVALDVLFALSEHPRDYIKLTRVEQEEIKELSKQYSCKVKISYDYIIQNGKAVPKIDSNSSYSISFNWKGNGTSLCEQDTSYLKKFALDLLPELFEKMRYIKDYRIINFYFSIDDKLHPVNGFRCNKHITIKRSHNKYGKEIPFS